MFQYVATGGFRWLTEKETGKLGEGIRIFLKEQGITIVFILTAVGNDYMDLFIVFSF